MSERDLNFAKQLAAAGYALDRDIQRRTKEIVSRFPDTDLFLIAVSQSLTWTGHAIDKANYFEKALDFLKSGSEVTLTSLSECAGRYGEERLKATIFNWRKLYNNLNPPPNILKSSLEEIILFQNISYKIACAARRKGNIINIGAWLFCAPFKVIICLRDDLWKIDRIDDILMPLGLEVVRGVKQLIRRRYSYSSLVNEGDLSEEEGDITEGLSTVLIVQNMCKTIAKDAGSNVLNINSGLWEFGTGNL